MSISGLFYELDCIEVKLVRDKIGLDMKIPQIRSHYFIALHPHMYLSGVRSEDTAPTHLPAECCLCSSARRLPLTPEERRGAETRTQCNVTSHNCELRPSVSGDCAQGGAIMSRNIRVTLDLWS